LDRGDQFRQQAVPAVALRVLKLIHHHDWPRAWLARLPPSSALAKDLLT
jgi:hypothetical protein